METTKNNTIPKLIKDLSTLSYLLHLKKFYLPANEFLSTVDLERYFSLIHQNIEQLIEQVAEKESDILLNDAFLPDTIQQKNDYRFYLDILDEALKSLINDYTQASKWYGKQDSHQLEGLLLSQKHSFQIMGDEVTSKQQAYLYDTPREKNIYQRKNEPFDSEAILNDIL